MGKIISISDYKSNNIDKLLKLAKTRAKKKISKIFF